MRSTDPLVGRTLAGRFLVHERLARGGMGTVYRAEQRPLGRPCALKIVLARERAEIDPAYRERFFREASVLSRLTHPNTVTVFDYGQSEGVLFLAMRLVEGRTLHHVVRVQGSLPSHRVVVIARQIASALHEAHALGIVHRDLKPSNVMLGADDHATVLDFGLAKPLDERAGLTQAGVFLGSPRHMAPEQIRGDTVTAATDVYALGATLYELLTGSAPFERPSPVSTMVAHLTETPAPIVRDDVPAPLAALVLQCLAKEPRARFGGMDAVIAALDTLGAPVAVAVEKPARPRVRARVITAAVVALLALGTVAVGLSAPITLPPGSQRW